MPSKREGERKGGDMKLFTAMVIGLAIGAGIAVLIAAGEVEHDSSFKTASIEMPGDPARRERRHA